MMRELIRRAASTGAWSVICTPLTQAMQLDFSRPLSPGQKRRGENHRHEDRRAPDPTPEPGHD